MLAAGLILWLPGPIATPKHQQNHARESELRRAAKRIYMHINCVWNIKECIGKREREREREREGKETVSEVSSGRKLAAEGVSQCVRAPLTPSCRESIKGKRKGRWKGRKGRLFIVCFYVTISFLKVNEYSINVVHGIICIVIVYVISVLIAILILIT